MLYAQPITQIVLLTTAHVEADCDTVTVTLGPDRLDLPEPFATLVTKLPHRRQPAHPVAVPQHPRWHTTPGALANRLRRIGIAGRAMRHAALIQLAAEIPPGMLASVLGTTTAVKWTKLASGDWTGYAATRSPSMVTAVCAIRSVIVGTPKTRTPPPDFGMATALTGAGK